MLKVVHEESEANATGGSTGSSSLLDQIVRDGARQMLAAALQAEVAAYIEAHREVVDEQGRRLVVRNGYHEPREVATAAGAVPVRAPRVRQAHRRGDRGTSAVLLGDPPGVDAEVARCGGGAAAAVSARPVQR